MIIVGGIVQIRAVIYTRQSLDRDGSGDAVARQLEACEKLCAARGWDVVARWTDNSVSAFSGKPRPGYDRALAMLEDQTESSKLGRAVGEMRLDIERGNSLSAAMAKHPKVFNDLYVAMVKSGETGGVLDSVLERLASTLEREVSLRHRVRSAMTYPIVVLGFVTLILMAMLLFIVPQFKDIYAQLNGTLPFPTRVLLKVSEIFRHDFIIVVVVVAGLIFAFRRWKRTDSGKAMWDRFKLRIPIFGSLL